MPRNTKTISSFIICALLILTMESNLAQNFETPRPSPNATVSQTVGVTHITIDYSSPGVKDRTIWGELVPFGEVWRTGANAVTSITFDDPVKINGKELPAGTYGIHTIPGETEWEIIFSKDTEVDGGSTYDPEKDALKIKVKPEEAQFIERMLFIFTNTTDNKTTVNLWWEKLRVPFDIEINTQEIVLAKANDILSWSPSFQAANYCLTNDVNLEQGLEWIQASVLLKEVYWNTRVLAQLQQKLGMNNKAITNMEKAIELGTKMENAPFDYDRMKELLVEWNAQ
ncbi:MAG: DUF2911 domain-containing protein [Bacteroidetes bacterium]|nr:DUF2911 domain-containing protein [Bacteroidota bacterium]